MSRTTGKPNLTASQPAAGYREFTCRMIYLSSAALFTVLILIQAAANGQNAIPLLRLVNAAAEEATDRPDGQDAAGRWGELNKEYQSGAVPAEEIELRSKIEQANERFKAREWAGGQAMIDEILAAVTSADYRKKRLLQAARKQRELEKRGAKTDKEDRAPPGANAAPGRDQAGSGEDLRIPTIEVYSSDHIRYLPIASALRELLLSMPETAQAAYRSTYEAPARQALEAARLVPFDSSYGLLRAVAERYPLTRAGREAWERLAERLADSHRLNEAAAALDTRLALPFDTADPASSTRPELLAQAAVLNLMAGNLESGQRRLDEILTAYPDETVRLRGEARLGNSLADSPLLKSFQEYARIVSKPPSQWPAPLGGYDHAGSPGNPEKVPLLGTEARWIHRFRNPASNTARPTGLLRLPAIKIGSSASRGRHPTLQLVSNGENIFVRQANSLLALDSRTGKRSWTHVLDEPDKTSYPQAKFRNQNAYSPQANSGDLGTRSLCAYQPGNGGEPRIVMLDHSTEVGFLRSGKAVYRQNRLLAFDADSGKLVWRLGRSEDTRSIAYGLAFTAPPTPAGGLLVAPAVRESGFYLVGITHEGSIKWLTRLYSFNASYYQRYGNNLLGGSSPAASGGIVYTAPGNGMICSVDASNGRLLWMTRYRSENREQKSHTWIHSQPIIVSDAQRPALLAAPPDSNYLSSFDAVSGKLLWERSFQAGDNQLLGADRERIYIGGSEVMAVSLENGEDAWKAELAAGSGGMGCLVGGYIYLPRTRNTIAKVDRESGKVIEKLRFRDERIPDGYKSSLFSLDDQLLNVASWGIAAILPQQESWDRIAREPGGKRFENARLLESEGKYTEALDIFYELLDGAQSKSFRGFVETEIISTVRRLCVERKDPQYIDRMLSYGRTGKKPPLIKKRQEYLDWRLREADLLLKESPALAAKAYAALLPEDGKFATSSEGNMVDVRLYAADVLRRLRYGREPDEEAEAAQQELEELLDELLAGEDARYRKSLSEDPGAQSLQKVALFGAHTPSAAEAEARLAVIELAAGHPQNARSHLLMLCEDYPVLARLPEITDLLERTAPEDHGQPRLRGIREPGEGAAWRQVYWLDEDHGSLVAAAPGTDPFPVTFSLKANRLRATDSQGTVVLERRLPGFPEIDTIKNRLQSHVEEPAVGHINGDRMVLFTAAGCYAFELPIPASPVPGKPGDPAEKQEAFNAAGFNLAWTQNYPHALERYTQRRAFFGSIRSSGTKNLFPKAHFSSEGDVVVLLPTGYLVCIDRNTGKYLWRAGPGEASVKGELRLDGRNFLSQSTSPPGMLRFSLAGKGIRRLRDWELVPGPKGMSGSQLVPGVADVMSGQSLEVRSTTSGRILWSRKSSPKLLHATAESIWLSSRGKVTIVSLRSGRSLNQISLPDNLQATYRFEDPATGRITLACTTSASNSYYCPNCGRMHTRATGSSPASSSKGVTLVQVDKDLKARWKTKIAGGASNYDGNRRVLEDGRWLFVFNEQDRSSEKWYTRVSTIDPVSGESELWLQVEISGKGTGLMPRISPVAGGLSVGNSEGYGWFTAARLASEDEDGGNDLNEDPGKKE
ncbi:MAG: PQQ-binding-like beta-propeller repeat protein [Planctomycetota bacterium]|nr:PQQ-binding-like beta-propeller repeat protein [Planctomycetota bacterium]